MRSEIVLRNIKKHVLKQFLALEQRFVRDSAFKSEYVKFIDEYIEKGYMSQVSKDYEAKESEEYVLPHQALERPESVTTKLKIMIDALGKMTLGTALNDKLMVRSNLQRDLINIILGFRLHKLWQTSQ